MINHYTIGAVGRGSKNLVYKRCALFEQENGFQDHLHNIPLEQDKNPSTLAFDIQYYCFSYDRLCARPKLSPCLSFVLISVARSPLSLYTDGYR